MKIGRDKTKPRGSIFVPQIRLRDIFPSGFDTSMSHSVSYGDGFSTFRLGQFYDTLVGNPQHRTYAETVVVTTAWFGKQMQRARHEFILLEVEDTTTPGLVNYISLDRNDGAAKKTCTSISRSDTADDLFKVAYDGDENKLLNQAKLEGAIFLDRLQFPPDEPLYLYELATLARRVSLVFPNYNPIVSNCYKFAGLVWECMRAIKPSAIYHEDEDGLVKYRGKYRRFRYRVDPNEVEHIQDLFWSDLDEAENKLSGGDRVAGEQDPYSLGPS